MSRAFFITLEGIEGAGKSTVGRWVSEWLKKRAIPARLTREPGGTPLAESVRHIALSHGQEPLSTAAETLLMFAARSIHVENLIRPTLEQGESVVCDRFTDATRAYQGHGREVDLALIETLAKAVHGELQPHCMLLLDLPVAVGLERARARSGAASDRFEAETAAFFERVRAGYLQIARREPGRVHVIDASRSLPEVERQVGVVLETLVAAAA